MTSSQKADNKETRRFRKKRIRKVWEKRILENGYNRQNCYLIMKIPCYLDQNRKCYTTKNKCIQMYKCFCSPHYSKSEYQINKYPRKRIYFWYCCHCSSSWHSRNEIRNGSLTCVYSQFVWNLLNFLEVRNTSCQQNINNNSFFSYTFRIRH